MRATAGALQSEEAILHGKVQGLRSSGLEQSGLDGGCSGLGSRKLPNRFEDTKQELFDKEPTDSQGGASIRPCKYPFASWRDLLRSPSQTSFNPELLEKHTMPGTAVLVPTDVTWMQFKLI